MHPDQKQKHVDLEFHCFHLWIHVSSTRQWLQVLFFGVSLMSVECLLKVAFESSTKIVQTILIW